MPLVMPAQNEHMQSPVRVFVTDSFEIDGVAITMGLRYSQEEVRVMRLREGGWAEYETVEPAVQTNPTLRLNNDFARALLEALLRYYNGSEDARTTRADLLHERERVDKLINMYGMLATTIAEKD